MSMMFSYLSDGSNRAADPPEHQYRRANIIDVRILSSGMQWAMGTTITDIDFTIHCQIDTAGYIK